MRFYVPEWDDHVDADYDFIHDEHSALDTETRDNAYIWDIFDHESTPIDGVLISREQVEQSTTKFEQLTSTGVYDEAALNLPAWIPTISDCGAWGYKSLPFPPYGNAEMLDFYEQMDVSVGVTIDHLVLGSGHTARLYLDKRAFSDEFTPDDLPETVTEDVDVMVDSWPDDWPSYVSDYEPSLDHSGIVDPFDRSLFDGSLEEVIQRLTDDPRAVYRDDDMTFRYELTLNNAQEMKDLYDSNGYSFRLMAAIQGWDPDSYVKATQAVLEMGYQYLGIGGMAGSTTGVVKDTVTAVGNALHQFERSNRTRVDAHVFGFAKTNAFETIGRSGMTSFDSASMLRAAWTGPENYHIDDERKYDALRVRYPKNGDDLGESVRKALYAQEVLHSLRAFDRGESIADAIHDWHETASEAIDNLLDYLKDHRFDEQFDASRLRDVERAFRIDYRYGRELKASFSDRFRGRLIKLLRSDNRTDPNPWLEYLKLVEEARHVFDKEFPTYLTKVDDLERGDNEVGTFDHLWPLIESYAEFIGDERHLEGYEELLRQRPWEDCTCPICTEHGIEVAIFRGNNRNRRRGFHNTRRFYNQFEEDLPKLQVLTRATTQLLDADTIEEYLSTKFEDLWNAIYDVPVAEIGVMTADGVHEWWESPPESLSLDPDRMASEIAEHCIRYQDVYLYEADEESDIDLQDQIEEHSCNVHTLSDPQELREAVDKRLAFPQRSQLSNY